MSASRHGFVRAANGKITIINSPGAGPGAHQGTEGFSINAAGDITGNVLDARNVYHGFVRAADGKIKTFEAPGAVQGTVGLSINAAGDIAGIYVDASAVFHGFVRTP